MYKHETWFCCVWKPVSSRLGAVFFFLCALLRDLEPLGGFMESHCSSSQQPVIASHYSMGRTASALSSRYAGYVSHKVMVSVQSTVSLCFHYGWVYRINKCSAYNNEVPLT